MRSFLPVPALYVAVLAAASIACAPAANRQRTSDSGLVTAEDLARYPGEPIERVIERKVPGITVTRTAEGALVMRIRGATSFDGSSAAPLYVLNSLEIEPGPNGELPRIDPYEIESIRVLKGTEAAIYGIRGANGVIIITMKTSPK